MWIIVSDERAAAGSEELREDWTRGIHDGIDKTRK